MKKFNAPNAATATNPVSQRGRKNNVTSATSSGASAHIAKLAANASHVCNQPANVVPAGTLLR